MAVIATIGTSTATGQRILPPEGVFYYKPAAAVFGAEATWINPAALSLYSTPSFQLMADYREDASFESWGTVISRERLAAAYRFLDNPEGDDFKEYVFALAMSPAGQWHLGGSYRYFKDGPGVYHKRHFWNLGLVGRSRGPLAWAAVFSNLNRGKVDGQRSEIEQRYSVAYRPFGNVATFSVDMLLSTGTKLRHADFIYHLEVTPRPGLYLEGYVTSDGDFQAGFRVNLVSYLTGTQSFFRRNGGYDRTTAYVGATAMRQPSLIAPHKRRRLNVSISGSLPENPPRPIFGRQQTSFLQLISALYRAAEDPTISETVLQLRGLSLGFGQAQELRAALTYLRSRGKTVICHVSQPNNIGYYVASAADSILIPPVSQLLLVGLRAELTFYAGTMEKLGINADVMRIGDYKTAAEQYTETAATEKNREQVNRILDDIFQQFVSAIAHGRGVSEEWVRRIIDRGPYTSQQALESGLVDGLSYRDQLHDGFLAPMAEISVGRYRQDTLLNDGWPAKPELALVVADGDIAFDSDSASPLDVDEKVTPRLMQRAFEQAVANPAVRGIILRINSPGGYALAGEAIHHSAARAAGEKPLVVSMSNVAASGGYYVAMPSSRLFADPATITGSIGIYGGKVDLSGLYHKIDLGKELYTRGEFAGMLSTIRPFTPAEREKYYSHMQSFYDYFVGLVAKNRSLATDSVDALARGRVWTGREALANGLVDELGGLKQTLDHTAVTLGLKEYRIAVYPQKRPLLMLPGESLLKRLGRFLTGGDAVGDLVPTDLPLPTDGEILARLPYDITIQ